MWRSPWRPGGVRSPWRPFGERTALQPVTVPARRRGRPNWFVVSLLIGAFGIVLMILSFAATGFLATHRLITGGDATATAGAAAASTITPAASPTPAPAPSETPHGKHHGKP